MKRGDKFATFRRARDLLVDHPNHDKLIRFAGWDAAAFEADGLLLPLSNFHLSLRKVFEREPHWHRPLTPLLASKDVLQQRALLDEEVDDLRRGVADLQDTRNAAR
mmetsp:Transcript_72886/g.207644  ORF Transcript_72886/g.207644 Transcript_72886/m.207644 type:complete len:106 (-) Transcript_72886:56-373(-)|eukprot:CAMPEP_0119540472 /NCGR_PEP_ID=MMETSP1344-20130328/52358_1 /TAXON_ID=236787 /ORGANISM="Florenciella parvula, Strain CCMP2471" /LENGTH=105 /DNA_ID=CAMNT_0007584233 /DNA_START=111 /DNA_END=428 /DNA_ORIENTATION=+